MGFGKVIKISQECTLKEAFIMKKLDELQPNWRTGEDVVWITKNKIKEYIEERYSEILSPTGSACLTFRSLENTIGRIRKKLNIEAKSTRHELEHKVIWQELTKEITSPELGTSVCEDCNCTSDQPQKEKLVEEKRIELVPVSCTNPECDKFALITPADKRLFFVTYPLRKGKFVRPYCSEECQQAHNEQLKRGIAK